MTQKYIVLSPVGDHKEHVLHEFIEKVKNQIPPPEDIVLCFDIDTQLNPEDYDCIIRYSPELSVHRGFLERICSAREILRNYFIYHPEEYQCALWVDSDIIIPPNTFQTLYDVMEKEQALIVVNKYPGRIPKDKEQRKWCGSGLMLTHRIACMISRFYLGKVPRENGKTTNLSEDFMFFAGIDQGRYFTKEWTGRSGRICDEFLEVEHKWMKE